MGGMGGCDVLYRWWRPHRRAHPCAPSVSGGWGAPRTMPTTSLPTATTRGAHAVAGRQTGSVAGPGGHSER